MALPHRVLKVSEGGDSPISLAEFNHSYHIFFFLIHAENFPGCKLQAFPIALRLHISETSLTPSCPLSSWRSESYSSPSPTFPTPGWQTRFPLPPLHIMPHSSSTALGLTLGLLLGSPAVDPAEHSKRGLTAKKQLVAALCWGSLACFSFPCLKGALLTHLQQVLHLGSCPAELLALPGNLRFALLQGLLLSHVKDLASVLIKFMKFLSARKDLQYVSANPSSFPSQEDFSYLSVFEF